MSAALAALHASLVTISSMEPVFRAVSQEADLLVSQPAPPTISQALLHMLTPFLDLAWKSVQLNLTEAVSASTPLFTALMLVRSTTIHQELLADASSA